MEPHLHPESKQATNIDPAKLSDIQGKQPPPVIVVGMHNSGTSILTEILHKSGIFFCANMQHYESYFFSRFINDRLIMGGGGNWAKLPLMKTEEVLDHEESIKPLILKHWLIDYLQWGYDGLSAWGIKDPRICILLPLYLKIFPEAKVVHIHRDPADVAASLTKRKKSGVGISTDFNHWYALAKAYTKRVTDHQNSCAHFIEIQYEEFCTKPISQTTVLFQNLDIPFTKSTEKLLEKVTPDRIGSYKRWLKENQRPKFLQLLRSIWT